MEEVERKGIERNIKDKPETFSTKGDNFTRKREKTARPKAQFADCVMK